MEKRLNEIVGDTAVLILRDIYVYLVHDGELFLKYGITHVETKLILQKVSRHLVYKARSHNYNIKASKVIFNEADLEKWVWREFLQEQIEKGYTTGEIADEIKQPLEKINGYLF